MNNDLIGREALLREWFKKCDRECCTCIQWDDESGDCGLIRYAPAVDAEPVRHGEWIQDDIGWVCSWCGTEFTNELEYIEKYYTTMPNHCPHCGTKMDLGDEV